MNTEIKIDLQDTQWEFDYVDHDRNIARAIVYDEIVASDLNYKHRFIHSFKCVYMLRDYPVFEENDFEYLRGKIQVLLPERDIFKKEDQKRLADLFRKLDAEILDVPGGHVGFIVQAEYYIDLIEKFLKKKVI